MSLDAAIVNFLDTMVATTTTTAKALTLDPKRAYLLKRAFAVRTTGVAAATMQLNLSVTSGLANAAASLTDPLDGHVAQAGAAAAPGTIQRLFASDADQRWFTGSTLYFQPFPDVAGDTFRYHLMLESRPLA